MFVTRQSTPARWVNTGGDTRVHLVPEGTRVLDAVADRDSEGYLPADHFQVTTPICGRGVYHGSWTHIDRIVPPLTLCAVCFPTGELPLDLTPYTTTDHQVWVKTQQGGVFAYRTGLIYSVAQRWAAQWNERNPEDQPGTFFAVEATTTFTTI